MQGSPPPAPTRLPARGLGAWLEIVRPFSFTASVIPVLVGLAAVLGHGGTRIATLPLVLLGAVAMQAGTNIINEYYDVLSGVDRPESPRASRVLVEGRLDADRARRAAFGCFALALLVAAVVASRAGWPVLALTLVGCASGYAYTAPPVQFKYRGLGAVAVFWLMGPLMVAGAAYALSGHWSPSAWWASVPVGCLVAAILLANEIRDDQDDAASGIVTLPHLVGQRRARRIFAALLGVAFAWPLLGILAGGLPLGALLPWLTAPTAWTLVRTALHARAGELATSDQATARLHLLYGLLLALGMAVAA
ncbi:MAG TPA: prenyltransferase [Bacillota bacterium]